MAPQRKYSRIVYNWEGTSRLTESSFLHKVVIKKFSKDHLLLIKDEDKKLVFHTINSSLPTKHKALWNAEDKKLVYGWARLLKYPPTHLVYIGYRVNATDQHKILLLYPFNFSIFMKDSDSIARSVGTFISWKIKDFKLSKDVVFLVKGKTSLWLWLGLISAKYKSELVIY